MVGPAVDILSFLDAAFRKGAEEQLCQLIQLTVVAALRMNEYITTYNKMNDLIKVVCVQARVIKEEKFMYVHVLNSILTGNEN